MGVIQRLPESLINRIAAGEVVERPAAVLKELVENALDAGARRVRIDLADDALSIRVSDDGSGMDEEDALSCCERHATSKLRAPEDLLAVTTLGFRGEALAAIAAVSELEIVTRRLGAPEGTRVRLEGGVLQEKSPAATPPGTTVFVNRLFFNTPARRRFLKSAPAERHAALQMAVRLALARPDVAFDVRSGGESRLVTPGDGDARAAVAAVVGHQEAGSLLSFEGARGPVGVSGLIGPPDLHRPRADRFWCFVNGRWIENRAVAAAVARAYESALPHGRFPVGLVYLSIDPERVDVNVHPAKLVVRFRDEPLLFGLVAGAVRLALSRAAVPHLTSARPAVWDQPAVRTGEPLAPPYPGPAVARPPRPAESPAPAPQVLPELAGDASLRSTLKRVRLIGQLHRTYILAETPRGLLVVDQHVAHERMLYEALCRARRGGPAPAQLLIDPIAVEVSPEAGEALPAACAWLERLGVQAEPFGRREWRVRSVPALPGFPFPAAADLRAILETAAHGALLPTGDSDPQAGQAMAPWEEHLLKSLACKAAVKAGEELTAEGMMALVAGLEGVGNPYTCPHGRPVLAEIPVEELDRRFGRRTPS